MKRLLILFLLAATVAVQAQTSLAPDAKGEKLREFYASLHVEDLWIAGQHINWETGKPDNPDATHNIKTHCSSFAASACKQLHIYILRPPDHAQGLLANAQYDWLMTKDAAGKGWHELHGTKPYVQAQEYANKGYVVVAIYQNPDREKPGHIALILPAKISPQTLDESGPRIIQAGKTNYSSATLWQGFSHHIQVWPSADILFYYNENLPF